MATHSSLTQVVRRSHWAESLRRFAFVLGVAASCCSAAQDAEGLGRGVVKITASSVHEGIAKNNTGTGFIVSLYSDSALIVTASHVVEGTQKILVQFSVRSDVTFPGTVQRMRGADPRGLAVLSVKDPPPGVVVLKLAADSQVKLSDDVMALGFPRISPGFSALPGKVASRDGTDILFAAPVDEGSSGGPLMRGGHVVGVVTEATNGIGRAVPAFIVAATLDGWGFAVKEPTPASGTPSPAGAASDHSASRSAPDPESAEALKQMFESLLEAARSGDKDKSREMVRQLVIPNYEVWFKDTFGAVNGARLAAEYAEFAQNSEDVDLRQLSERAKSGISAYSVREPNDPQATGGQKTVLEAMKKPVALYGVRLDGLHLWNFVYVDGAFRLAGKMYPSLREQDGN